MAGPAVNQSESRPVKKSASQKLLSFGCIDARVQSVTRIVHMADAAPLSADTGKGRVAIKMDDEKYMRSHPELR